MITATTTCEILASSTVCNTETIQNFIGGFSYGEILTITILLMIFSVLFFSEIRQIVLKSKINNYINK